MKYIHIFLILIAFTYAQAPADGDSSWKTAVLGKANDETKATTVNFMLKYAPDTNQTNNSQIIHFMLSGMSPGYIAFGVANGKKMQNIDIISFEYDSGNTPTITVTDRFSNSLTKPMEDTVANTSNYLDFDITSSFNDQSNMWILKWSRSFISTDSNQDIPLYCGKNPVVIATADSPTFTKHTLYQSSVLEIDVTSFTGCQAAPSGWTDWAFPPDQIDEPVEDFDFILKLNLLLFILNLIIF